MNPERFTTRQLLENFTAKHWCYTIGAFAAALTVAANLGNYYGKSESAVRLAELKGDLDKVALQLNVSEEQKKQVLRQNGEWIDGYRTLEKNYQAELQKSSALALKIAQSSNNDFIHEQITDTQNQIDSIRHMLSTSGSSNYSNMKALEVQALEARLRGYQVQLNTCQ